MEKVESGGGASGGWTLSPWISTTFCTYTTAAILVILTCQLLFNGCRWSLFRFRFSSLRFSLRSNAQVSAVAAESACPQTTNISVTSALPQSRISTIISDLDLKYLIDNLDEKLHEEEKWENVTDRSNDLLSYKAKCCKPKDGPLKYLSVTVFKNCAEEVLRDFYLDNDYRKRWDKTLVEHEQLQVDVSTGTEVGRTIKKFPLLTPREYVLAWRVWEGKDKSFYCFSKECEHPLAPQRKKYVRVRFFRSGWRIRKVPGTNACEIKMFHQEDAGLNVEMAKLAFSKGIWSYVCKMDNALRTYSIRNTHPLTLPSTAVTLIQKVPPGLVSIDTGNTDHPETSTASADNFNIAQERSRRKLPRKPSKKAIANGLILLGGMVCLSRGHSNLGAKVAMAYILSKISNRGPASG